MPTENRNTDWAESATRPLQFRSGMIVMERKSLNVEVLDRPESPSFPAVQMLRGNFNMRCNQCREWNPEEEHRCRRCGRRLMTADAMNGAPSYDRYPVTMGAAAPKYDNRRVPLDDRGAFAAQTEQSPLRVPTYHRHRAVQTSLFERNDPRKVVPIAPDSPARAEKRGSPRSTPSNRPGIHVDLQQKLLFTPPDSERTRSAGTSIEAVIYCTDPVASIMHRLLATVADLALIAISVGLFTIAFFLAGGEIMINRQTVLVYGSIPLIIAGFYKYLWAIAGADSPGMVWAGLRTVNFDGKKPDKLQRFLRIAGGFLGLAATGIGLIWAFVDEETLTWHDHISNTFTTPV